jgi:hypothetical protein
MNGEQKAWVLVVTICSIVALVGLTITVKLVTDSHVQEKRIESGQHLRED